MNKKSNFFELCDKLSFWIIFAFAVECVLGCSGQWLSFRGFSIRMLLFCLAFLLTLPNVFSQLRKLIRSPYVIIALLFGFYLVIAAVIGWRRGNNPGFIKADITGFLTLALLPGFIATINSKERIFRLMDAIFYGSVGLGIITVFLHFLFAFISNGPLNAIYDWLNEHYMGGFARTGSGMHRIYLRSHIFLQVGLLIGMIKCWKYSGWKRWLLLAAESVLFTACLVSLTRGFWIGCAVSAFCLLVLQPRHWKRYVLTACATIMFFGVLFAASSYVYKTPTIFYEIAGRMRPELIQGAIVGDSSSASGNGSSTKPTDDPDDAELSSVTKRMDTLPALNQRIAEHPLFGNGLGANLDGIRDDGKTEYTYQDHLMKLGLVGFLLFLGVFLLPTTLLVIRAVRILIRKKRISWDSPEMLYIVLATAFIGVALTSYFNPFMTNPMGILLVMLTTAAVCQTNTTLLEEK